LIKLTTAIDADDSIKEKTDDSETLVY